MLHSRTANETTLWLMTDVCIKAVKFTWPDYGGIYPLCCAPVCCIELHNIHSIAVKASIICCIISLHEAM